MIKKTNLYLITFLAYSGLLFNLEASSIIKDPEHPLLVTVNLDDGGVQQLHGIEIPLLDNEFEKRRGGDFSHGMTRMISKEKVYLMRVHTKIDENLPDDIKQIAYLGVDGTYLAAKFFKNADQAQHYSALLTKWYTRKGGLAQYSVIEVPSGTEMYVGNAKTQMETQVLKRTESRKERPDKLVTRELRLGGGVQLLVPPKNFAGYQQLTMANVLGTYNLKKE